MLRITADQAGRRETCCSGHFVQGGEAFRIIMIPDVPAGFLQLVFRYPCPFLTHELEVTVEETLPVLVFLTHDVNQDEPALR